MLALLQRQSFHTCVVRHTCMVTITLHPILSLCNAAVSNSWKHLVKKVFPLDVWIITIFPITFWLEAFLWTTVEAKSSENLGEKACDGSSNGAVIFYKVFTIYRLVGAKWTVRKGLIELLLSVQNYAQSQRLNVFIEMDGDDGDIWLFYDRDYTRIMDFLTDMLFLWWWWWWWWWWCKST